MDGAFVKLCAGSVKEADLTGEVRVWIEPDFSGDPQPAADLVELLVLRPQGRAVRRHAIRHFFPVDQPGHADVIWVEIAGQTDEGLLPLSVFLVPTLVWRRPEQVDPWSCDTDSWFWMDTRPKQLSLLTNAAKQSASTHGNNKHVGGPALPATTTLYPLMLHLLSSHERADW